VSNGDFNFENLQMQIDKIEEKLKAVPTKKEMKLSNEKLVDRVMDRADKRYASKTTEKIVYAGIGAILLWGLKQVLSLL